MVDRIAKGDLQQLSLPRTAARVRLSLRVDGHEDRLPQRFDEYSQHSGALHHLRRALQVVEVGQAAVVLVELEAPLSHRE